MNTIIFTIMFTYLNELAQRRKYEKEKKRTNQGIKGVFIT
jgi:hypothetical protein